MSDYCLACDSSGAVNFESIITELYEPVKDDTEQKIFLAAIAHAVRPFPGKQFPVETILTIIAFIVFLAAIPIFLVVFSVHFVFISYFVIMLLFPWIIARDDW